MSQIQRLQRRTVLLAGLGLFGASLHSFSKLKRSGRGGDDTGMESDLQRIERDQDAPLRLGWSAWADAEVVSLMAASLIESRLNVLVERVMADIGIQYESVARGDLNLMLMAWLPGTHKDYWARVRDRVRSWAHVFRTTGLIVPDYVPVDVLSDITQLRNPETAKRFDNRVQESTLDPESSLSGCTEVLSAGRHAIDRCKQCSHGRCSCPGHPRRAVVDRHQLDAALDVCPLQTAFSGGFQRCVRWNGTNPRLGPSRSGSQGTRCDGVSKPISSSFKGPGRVAAASTGQFRRRSC